MKLHELPSFMHLEKGGEEWNWRVDFVNSSSEFKERRMFVTSHAKSCRKQQQL